MIALSSGHFSTDDQIADVISYLSIDNEYASEVEAFEEMFPEYNSLVWSGSYVDTEESNVDSEYMNWVADWLEFNTNVSWVDGEPYLFEYGEEDFDDDLSIPGGFI